MSTAVIELNGITFGYGDDRPVLHDLNWTVPPGARVGVSGANATGKSTLLHICMGLRRAQSGSVKIYGKQCLTERDFHEVRARMGLLFQDSDDQLFCPTVLDDVAFGPLHLGATPTTAQAAAYEALDQVGLAGYEERITSRLSAGEKKCVALATILAMQPHTLLLDEPTSFLDEPSRERLLNVLNQLQVTLIIVSHDRAFMDALTTRHYHLQDGQLAHH